MLTPKDYLGGVPLVVRLHPADIISATAHPGPATFVLPRTTMLLAVLPDVLALFSPVCAALQSNSTQVWFSMDGTTPVDWTCPVGAVKDYVTELKRIRQRAALACAEDHGSVGVRAGGDDDVAAAAAAPAPALAPDTATLEPLELVFRIRQPLKAAVMERRIPFFMSFDKVDEYVRREVKQVLKASYTAMYGCFKLYHQVPADALLPVDGLALYRPFDADAGGGTGTGAVSGGGAALSTLYATSPHVVSDYQHLLREVLHRRPAAYLVRLGFPLAHAHGHTGGAGDAALRFTAHRVSAAPPVLLPLDETEAQGTGEVRGVGVGDAGGAAVDERVEAVTLGHLLWRLFRVPCLRLLAAQSTIDAASPGPSSTDGVGVEEEVRDGSVVYARLLRFLAARYYTDAPPAATEPAGMQEPLRTVPTARLLARSSVSSPRRSVGMSPLEAASPSTSATPPFSREAGYGERDEVPPVPPVPWAAWEAAMVERLVSDYDDEGREAGGVRGLRGFGVGPATGRLVFEVQGTQPLLETPVKFLETLMSSSDRAIYVTIRVLEG